MTHRQAQWMGASAAIAGMIGGFTAAALFDSDLIALLAIGGVVAAVFFVTTRKLGPYKPTPEEAAEDATKRRFLLAALPLYGLASLMFILDVPIVGVVLFVTAILVFEVGPRMAKRM